MRTCCGVLNFYRLSINNNDDDVFITLSGLPVVVRYADIAVDSTLLLSALGSSIYYTFWLSRESNLRLIYPCRSQLQKKDLQVDFNK